MKYLIVFVLFVFKFNPEPYAQKPRVGTPEPNIIFILADDMGYGDIAA